MRRKDLRRWLPDLDSRRTTSTLFLPTVTPFYGTYSSKAHAYRLGQKPPRFARSGRLTKRQLLQLGHSDGHRNAILEAFRYRACLDAESTRNRAEVAVMFGVSRARVTQYLNLLKLPSAIVNCLADCTDPAVISYFTERRLRPMTMMVDKADVLRRFSAMVSEIKETDREHTPSGHERSA